ncbi:MAG TPA: sulfatase, partial [Thermoanaerobaculia bacterium]|nr:sulfatase [Thermoanaerobaculia bacterium]
RQLGFALDSPVPIQLDLLEVSAVPKEARYAAQPVGVHTEPRRDVYRRALAVHTPARLEYQIAVPEQGRLDFGLGVLRRDVPVSFRVRIADGSGRRTVFAQTAASPEEWRQRSVDLSRWAGRTVRLVLEAESARAGTVAFWAAPTVSGARAAEERRPNVILYVIDAGNAEFMSAYGYPRRTTPNLERLAAEGAIFERAYSNSTWSKPSTTSFMTSLQHSVLGGYENPADPLPAGAPTMAELLHAAGWQTGVFTSNTWCGTMSGLDRGVDEMRETLPGPPSASSEGLQAEFWRWREGSPGEPYWTHFQTTDVHWPWTAVPPVAGAFLSHAEREAFYDMERRLGAASGTPGRSWGLRAGAAAFEKAGISRDAYFDGVRGAYDEALLHNDLQLGRLVERLKATGEWAHTILIVTADHGDWPGLGLFPPADPAARIPTFNPYLTHVPLVVVWPERIRPGQRFRDPVALLDLLPTVLDLAGQPKPEHLMGQSLAPLLLGEPLGAAGWKPRPVILDEFTVDPATKRLAGAIEIVDGRWGASLAIGPDPGEESGPRLLLYDLWNDPYCRRSLHAERPDLARRYAGRLETVFRDHLRRGKAFRRAAPGTVGSRQLETLRSLGYIN